MAKIHNVSDQPFTWIVMDDSEEKQLGIVDEIHNMDSIVYQTTWFESGNPHHMFRSSFTTAVLTILNAN